jgi:hypothetical protein
MSRSSTAAAPFVPPKASITDEPLDAYVNRPLAALIVRAVEGLPAVSPNHLTYVSAILGTFAAIGIYGAPLLAVPGAVALFLCMVFDCSDGQLARLRGGGSPLGRILDGYADYWVAFWVHFAILSTFFRDGVVLFGHPLSYGERFLFVLAAGVSMGVNAGRFDHYKQRFLAHTGAAREPETPETYFHEADRHPSIVARGLLRLFGLYVRAQQGPEFQANIVAARATASDPAKVARFVSRNSTLLRLWSITGPTTHNGVICITLLLSPFVPGAFAAYCLFAIVVANVYSLALLVFQRRVVRAESRD